MNNEGFGIRKFTIVPDDGGSIPTINSPNVINLNGYAVNIRGDLNVHGEIVSDLIVNDFFDVGIASTQPRGKLDVVGDAYIGTDPSSGIVLTSPNGTAYRLVVDNAGNLITAAV